MKQWYEQEKHTLYNKLYFIYNNKLKLFVVGVPLVFSSLGTYFTIEYASKGELGEATIAGICTLLNAYYAGYQHKSIDSRDNASCHF